MSHEDFDISDNREAVFFINKGVSSSLENDVRDQSGPFISSWVLSDRNSDSKMIVWKIRANGLVSKNNLKAYNRVLRVLSALEKHVDVDMLNKVKFFL